MTTYSPISFDINLQILMVNSQVNTGMLRWSDHIESIEQ